MVLYQDGPSFDACGRQCLWVLCDAERGDRLSLVGSSPQVHSDAAVVLCLDFVLLR